MQKGNLLTILVALAFAACSTTNTTTTSIPPIDESTETAQVESTPIDEEQMNSDESMPDNEVYEDDSWTPQGEGQDMEATPASMESMPENMDVDPSQAMDQPNLFNNTTAGFSIQKPEQWSFLSNQLVAASREQINLEDKDLEKMVKERASAPLVAMAKHQEPFEDLNPGVQVMVRPLGPFAAMAPTEMMRMTANQLKNAFPDFAIVEDIQEAQVDGLNAAHMKMQYTVASADGRQFQTTTWMWLVPRGEQLFTIGMSGPQEGPDMSDAEFQQIFDSIRIEKQ